MMAGKISAMPAAQSTRRAQRTQQSLHIPKKEKSAIGKSQIVLPGPSRKRKSWKDMLLRLSCCRNATELLQLSNCSALLARQIGKHRRETSVPSLR
jgi:hypothetical protein